MAQTETRPGFRLPWTAERSDSDQPIDGSSEARRSTRPPASRRIASDGLSRGAVTPGMIDTTAPRPPPPAARRSSWPTSAARCRPPPRPRATRRWPASTADVEDRRRGDPRRVDRRGRRPPPPRRRRRRRRPRVVEGRDRPDPRRDRGTHRHAQDRARRRDRCPWPGRRGPRRAGRPRRSPSSRPG